MVHGSSLWLTIILFGLSVCIVKGQITELKQPINLNVEAQQLVDVLKLIDAQTLLSFSYNPNKLPSRALVNYNSNNQNLEVVLKYISATYHLSYEVIEKQIVLLPAKDKSSLLFNISGFVIDKNTGESLIGATIIVDSLNLGVGANGYGYFSISLPYGIHKINTSFLGYELNSQRIDLTSDQTIEVKLEQAAPHLDEIIVIGNHPTGIDLVQTGKLTITPKSVAETPAAFGEKDVIKALEKIPGISLQSDGSTFFYVRGGNKDQNLILIDDAPIYNPSHLLGFYSSIIPDAVNSIDVYKSDFPLSKGGRLSSVIDIKTKEGNKNRFSAWGNIGIVSTQVGLEGPIKKGSSSYLISGRLSRIKWIFKNEIKDLDQFQFYDVNGKTNFTLNDKNKLYFSFYTGADHFLTTSTGLSWSNINGSIRWNNLINKKTFVNTTLYGSNYEYFLYLNRVKNQYWRSRIGEFGLKSDFSHFINANQELSFGININGRTINPGNLNQANLAAEYIVSVRNNLETAAYFQHDIRLNSHWGVKYGIRTSLWTSIGESFEFDFDENGDATEITNYNSGEIYHNYLQLEPRVTAKYSFNDKSAIKLSYGRSVQNLHLIANTISPFTSFEVWLPSGPNIMPQQADMFSLSYGYYLKRIGISFDIEAYYKQMYNQIDYVAHASTLLNPTIESELVFGSTKGYGIEFLARKEEGRIRGMLGYTLSKAKSTFIDIDFGSSFNAYSDRPHHLSLNVNYDIGLRVTLGSNFTYNSGLPFSSPSSFYTFDGNEVPVYERKNNDRFPDYHRLDVSASFVLNKNLDKKFRHSLTLSIYNLYGHENPVFINFNKQARGDGDFEVPTNLLSASRLTTQTYLYGVTPSISYQFRF